jgi:hypothetical protein
MWDGWAGSRVVLRTAVLPARYNFLYFIKARARRGLPPAPPRLAAPGGALASCRQKWGDTLCGWGGRLHGLLGSHFGASLEDHGPNVVF